MSIDALRDSSLISRQTYKRFIPHGLVLLIVLIGLILRLVGLGDRTMTHIEIYVPGIHLPDELAIPRSRLTVQTTLADMITAYEPHPPGYYLLMLGWTKIFGSGIWSLRIPSVLLGLACIILVFLLGVQENNRPAGILGALLVAVNGHQIYWSQLAKNYIFAEFFGLFATVMLLAILRSGKRERLLQVSYLFVLLTGTFMTIYFWLILITHMIWSIIERWNEKTLPGIFQWQYLAFILGTPLLSLAIFQSRRSSYLETEVMSSLAGFLEFGYAFEVIPNSLSDDLWIRLIVIFLLFTGTIFLCAGIFSSRKRKETRLTGGLPGYIFVISGLLMVPVIIFLGRYLSGWDQLNGNKVYISALIPLIMLVLFFIIRGLWINSQEFRSHSPKIISSNLNFPLTAYLSVIPVLFLLIISPFVALFASRGILIYIPYLLLTMATGVVVLVKRASPWLVVGLVIILVIPIGNLFFRDSGTQHQTDYKALAEAWLPQIDDTDLIFVRRAWPTTPIFYYLDVNRYRVIGDLRPDSYQTALQTRANSRVWVLNILGMKAASGMREALRNYHIVQTLRAKGIQADLYEKKD